MTMLGTTPIKAVLFDLDGTLLDTAPEFYFIANQMLEQRDIAPVDYAVFRESVSDGARGMVKTAFSLDENDPQFEPLRLEFLAQYSALLATRTELFAGMNDVLDFIESESLAWGIVTNKPNAFAEPLLRALNLFERCAVLVCPDHVRDRKPHPEALYLACDKIGCSIDEAIYVGDHRRDIEAARNANMTSIACSFGYVHGDDPCENWSADFIAHDAIQIIPILQNRLD
ncbi:MAG: phosphoglycolate phosphatase [Verrucomicrobiaceae bacterium]|nr:phosphoglycolate phosphatase [Verrucomicrobiaceae bacterium]